MTRLLWWMPVFLLLTYSSGSGAPVKGAFSQFDVRIEANSQKEFDVSFQGGRRACVIAVGNRKAMMDVGIDVYDEANHLVTEDRGLGFAAAIWYPAREAKFKVVVKNIGADYNAMYLVFK
ncbi:MAG TPA: hypothetical protein VNX28_17875 [Gemmataceae bacterium]|jgi:hypothetical protein|nr:hypothetical protein [Gemmataceae bacterium]